MLYIAGMGAITPLGINLPNTFAAVNAGISAYAQTEHYTDRRKPIVMARVPDTAFEHIPCEIDHADVDCWLNRLIRMAIAALRESVAEQIDNRTIPLIIAMPEHPHSAKDLSLLATALHRNIPLWVQPSLVRPISGGRASGVEAINFVFNYVQQSFDYFLVMGVDSFDCELILQNYQERILFNGAMNSFAPGEAASALLITRHKHLALQREGCVMALHLPGMAEEDGHLHSTQPYRGNGLSQAFRMALQNQPPQTINRIYSSMNGENYWAKEYGVACLRNQQKLSAQLKIEHPAEFYGDLGAATGTTLIALAAQRLFASISEDKYLVYCSSDTAMRGALVVEKLKIFK